jgi:hypothetical protein
MTDIFNMKEKHKSVKKLKLDMQINDIDRQPISYDGYISKNEPQKEKL